MSYRWVVPPEYDKVLNAKDKKAQHRFLKAMARMDDDLRYPSLRVSKLQGRPDTWYARASRGERITFELHGDTITLIMNCGHEIL